MSYEAYEGTTGIQANDLIGRKLARDGGAAMKQLIIDMRADADSDRAATAVGARGGVVFGNALRDLTEATDWRLAAQAREAAAGAVPYLMLCGTVIGGWLMVRAAAVGTDASSGSGADTDIMAAKRITAQHYALHVLPESSALRDEVVHGAVSTLGLNDAQF